MRSATAGLAVVALLVSACSGHHSPVQSDADAVTSPLPVLVKATTTGCTSPLQLSIGRSSTLVTVGSEPSGGTLRWYAGMNAKNCKPTSTTLDQASARKLAAAIRSAPKFPSGLSNCPMEDGHAVDIYLDYTSKSEPEVVHFQLDGCAELDAPGRGARQPSVQLRQILRPFAPSYARGWLR